MTEPSIKPWRGTEYGPHHGRQRGEVSARPILTADGRVLYVTPNGNMYLATAATNRQFIAGERMASSRSTRRRVARTAGLSSSPVTEARARGCSRHIAANTDEANGAPKFGWQIIRLAGEGLDGFKSGSTRRATWSSTTPGHGAGRHDRIQGHPLGTGYRDLPVRLSFFAGDAYDPDPIAPVSATRAGSCRWPSRQDARRRPDHRRGTWSGDQRCHRGQITFWAQTSGGKQEIVLANQRRWSG